MKILPNDNFLKFEERTKLVVPDVENIDKGFEESFDADFPGVTQEVGRVAGNVASFLKDVNRETVSTTALVTNQLNLVHAAGCALDDIASLFGIRRHAKTATRVQLTFEGVSGTVIKSGTEVTDEQKETVFKTEDSVTISDTGTVKVYASNTVKGAITVDTNTLVNLVVADSGITSVKNDVGETGSDEETDEQLRVRIFMQRYSGYALLESIRSGLLATDGVMSCYCEENKKDIYQISKATGLDNANFLGFSVTDPTGTASATVTVFSSKKTSGTQESKTATAGQFVFYRSRVDQSASAADTRNYRNKVVRWTVSGGTGSWVVVDGAVTLRPHSVWCVVSGGSEKDIAKTLFRKKSSGSDYSTLGESVSDMQSFDISVPYADVVNGVTSDVRFSRPEEVSYSIEVEIIRHKYDGSDAALKDAINNAISNWQRGNVFGVDGLSVGDNIYSYEVGAAISEKIPPVKIKRISVVEMKPVIEERLLLKAKCTARGPGNMPRDPVYKTTGEWYPVLSDNGVLYLMYDAHDGDTSIPSNPQKNHLTLVSNVQGTTQQALEKVTPKVVVGDLYVSDTPPPMTDDDGLYVNYRISQTVEETTYYKSYTTLQAAWNDASDGDILVQRNNDTVSADITLTGAKNIVLDMNGYSFTSTKKLTVDVGARLRICNNKTVTARKTRDVYAPENRNSGNNGWFACEGLVSNGTIEVNGASIDTGSSGVSGAGAFGMLSGYLKTKEISVNLFSQSGGKVECTNVASAAANVSGGYLITSSSPVFTNANAVVSGGYIYGTGIVGHATSFSGGAVIDVPGSDVYAFVQDTVTGTLYKPSGQKINGGTKAYYTRVPDKVDDRTVSCLFDDYPARQTFYSSYKKETSKFIVDKKTEGIYYKESLSANGIAYDKNGYSFSSFFNACGIRTDAQGQVASPTAVANNFICTLNGNASLRLSVYGSTSTLMKQDVEIYKSENGLPFLPAGSHRQYEFDLVAFRQQATEAVYPTSDGTGAPILNLDILNATVSDDTSSVTGVTVRKNAYTSDYGIKYVSGDIPMVIAPTDEQTEYGNVYTVDTGVDGKAFKSSLEVKPYQIGSLSADNIGIRLEDE